MTHNVFVVILFFRNLDRKKKTIFIHGQVTATQSLLPIESLVNFPQKTVSLSDSKRLPDPTFYWRWLCGAISSQKFSIITKKLQHP